MLPPPLTIDHDTAVFDVPVTVLVNVVAFPSCTLVVTGETLTMIGGGGGAVSVIVASANEDGLDTDVARIVTEAEAGICVGDA